jgi:hypothetical protein
LCGERGEKGDEGEDRGPHEKDAPEALLTYDALELEPE